MAEEYEAALTYSNKHIKKPHLHIEWFAQSIYWKLAEELKPPERARNPIHKMAEQNKKREWERKGI